MKVPEYKSVAGQLFPVGSLGKSDRRYRICNTTIEECREYARTLEQAGFIKQAEKEFTVDDKEYPRTNLAYTYYKEDLAVFLFWDASIHTAHITAEKFGDLPFPKQNSRVSERVASPTVTQFGVYSGMCYVVRLYDGSFVLIDGGEYCEQDVEDLYAFLKAQTAADKPEIVLWIFTHAHIDHIGLATEFLARYAQQISVQAFAYQFPCGEKVEIAMESAEKMQSEITKLEENIRKYYPQAVVYSLHTGQVYPFNGAEIEILWTVDNMYPCIYTSINDFSAALRIRFDSGRTVMFLGDCMHAACRRIAHLYGAYLKSDIMQVAHHGLIGGDRELYKWIDPEICLWPTTPTNFLGTTKGQRFRWCLGEGGCDYNAYIRNDDIKKRVHYCHEKTVSLPCL